MQLREPPAVGGKMIAIEDALFAEALALGLPATEEFRPQLIAALRTRNRDLLAASIHISSTTVRQHYDQDPSAYRAPDRISFEHRFYTEHAQASAAQPDANSIGEPFLYGEQFQEFPVAEIASLFGNTFAHAVGELAIGADGWHGPLRSDYGYHLVRVTDQRAGQTRSFVEVEEQIREQLFQTRLQELETAWLDQLLQKYQQQPASN
ncbi:MAG: peptidylprolyl isomerase [Pseudomonadota bacterium]